MNSTDELRALAWYAGMDVEEAGRSCLLVLLATHSAAHVRSSGGWAEAPVIAKLPDDVGYDRVWARFMHAFGVNMTSADECSTAEPEIWGESFWRKPPDVDDVDGNAPTVTPMARVPLMFRACKGHSVRAFDPQR
eukprot:8446017-Pyramimonas_sp.AAC.1